MFALNISGRPGSDIAVNLIIRNIFLLILFVQLRLLALKKTRLECLFEPFRHRAVVLQEYDINFTSFLDPAFGVASVVFMKFILEFQADALSGIKGEAGIIFSHESLYPRMFAVRKKILKYRRQGVFRIKSSVDFSS